MKEILTFIGLFLLEYALLPIILGYIMTAMQFKPSINFSSKFEEKTSTRLIIETLVFSLVFFILHIIVAIVIGEMFIINIF